MFTQVTGACGAMVEWWDQLLVEQKDLYPSSYQMYFLLLGI